MRSRRSGPRNVGTFEAWCELRVSQIMSQAQGKANHGLPFTDEYWMNIITEKRDVRLLLDLIEAQAALLDRDYANAFRYLFYEDIYNHVKTYVRHLQSKIPPDERMTEFM